MNQISHKQAIHWIDLRLDGLLTERQLFLLDEHLRSCDSCSAYATEIEQVPGHLQTQLHARWDEKPGPSPKVMQYVTTKAKGIPVANRIWSGINWFAGVAALLILGIAINFVISRLQSITPATGTQAANGPSKQVETGLLSFTSDQNGNFDIYTIRPDGSALTNLTNHPADDVNPVWSPDGTRIFFESDRDRPDGDGSMHIYSMSADGSDVTRLTDGEGNYVIGTSGTLNYTPWSPDGTKLIFLDRAGGAGKLYVMDANGENKTLLSEPGGVYYSSWSPDGQRVAFIAGNPDADKRLYIVNADGSNPIDLGQSLPENENIDAYNGGYHWSQDGQSIFFRTYQLIAEGQGLSIVYEFSLLDNQLRERVRSGEPIIDWWQDTSFIAPHSYDRLAPMTFLRGDGTSTTFKPFEPCESVNKSGYGFDSQRSSHGNLVISAHCPEEGWWLYWANPDGTVTKQLLNAPIAVEDVHFFGITWSPDDRFITFYSTSGMLLDLYILDVEAALQDPSTQLVKATTTKNRLYNSSWQPVVSPTVQVIEEQPTPMATSHSQTQPSPQTKKQLLAFVSTQNGNSDIYSMHADGSELTKLTNDPAHDGSPFWSPDGTQIAFVSDRSGSSQIYLMGADGSNIRQLTNGEGNPQFDINGHTPWSPDGTKLIFVNKLPEEQDWKLYALDIDGGHTTTLTSEPGEYLLPSWSPDGEYIAFIYYESDARPLARHLFVVDKDGNHLTELTESLQIDQTGTFLDLNYYWSPDGASIFFTASSTVSQETTLTVYEAGLDGSLTARTKSAKFLIDWWKGTTLQQEGNVRTLTWLRADGSQSTLDICEGNDQISSDQIVGIGYKRSNAGSLVIGSNCSASDGWMLYWANPDGTIANKLLNSPIGRDKDNIFNMIWSPDDHFIALVVTDFDPSNENGALYILDVEQARNDPSVQPLKMEASSNPSWQPIITEEIVEKQPTPKPEPTLVQGGLVAFTAAIENGDLDIYTMRPDGSELTNLTNHPARDVNPYWSPDGRRVAFESDRDGFTHIFLIDSDGSNIFQVTNGEAQHQFANANPWSPDGSKLLFTEWTPEEEKWMLLTIDVNGQNKTLFPEVPNAYSNPSWSPDGQHVVFHAGDPQNPGDNRLYVIDADGQNRRELTQSFQADEQLSSMEYDWSPDGQSIFFISLLQTTDPSWTVYEARVADSSLITRAATKTLLFDWWNDISVVSPFIWKRSEETLSTLDPYTNCQQTGAAQLGSYMKRSPNGAWLVSAYCPNGDVWLYWVRSDGTLNRQLLDVPIPSEQRTFSDLVWSPDEKFVAFNVFSNNLTDMYILDVEASLNDPSIKPLKITVSGGNLFSNMSWRSLP